MSESMPNRLRVFSDGTLQGTKLVSEGGEVLQGFSQMVLDLDVRKGLVWATIELYGLHLDITATERSSAKEPTKIRIECEGTLEDAQLTTEYGKSWEGVKRILVHFDAKDPAGLVTFDVEEAK